MFTDSEEVVFPNSGEVVFPDSKEVHQLQRCPRFEETVPVRGIDHAILVCL
jgi:hypothetical protein